MLSKFGQVEQETVRGPFWVFFKAQEFKNFYIIFLSCVDPESFFSKGSHNLSSFKKTLNPTFRTSWISA